MKLKTHICKKTPTNINGEYGLNLNSNNITSVPGGNKENTGNDKTLENLPLSCVDWSSNDEIYFVRLEKQF